MKAKPTRFPASTYLFDPRTGRRFPVGGQFYKFSHQLADGTAVVDMNHQGFNTYFEVDPVKIGLRRPRHYKQMRLF